MNALQEVYYWIHSTAKTLDNFTPRLCSPISATYKEFIFTF